MSRNVSLLAYDADCGFCSATATWLASLKCRGPGKLEIISYQSPILLERIPGADLSHADRGVQLTLDDARIVRDAAAIAECLRMTRSLHWLGTFLRLPGIRWFAQAGYGMIARNRRGISRLLGMKACRIKPPSHS